MKVRCEKDGKRRYFRGELDGATLTLLPTIAKPFALQLNLSQLAAFNNFQDVKVGDVLIHLTVKG